MDITSERSRRVSPTFQDLSKIDKYDCVQCDTAQRFKSLIETGPSVIVCLAPDHRIIEFNRAAERVYGQTRAAVLGQDYVKQFIPDHQQKAVVARIRQALDGHTSQDFENSIRAPNREERILLWSINRVLDAAGQPSGIIAVGQDITARKRAEETLRRYEHIVRTSGDLMAFVDTDYVYQAVNAPYCDAFGKTQDQIVGHPVTALLGDEVYRSHVKPNLDRCLAGEPVRYQLWLGFPTWGRRYLDIHLNPFLDADGTVSGVVAASRDITERRRAEQALIAYQQRLRTLASELALAGQRERRRVAVGLHDQVGQALSVAKLKLGTALESALCDHTRRALEDCQALLDQSLQATRSLTFQLSSAVLKELGLEAALQQLADWFDAKNSDTRFVCAVDRQPKTLSEDQELMLYDIARELLFNALKYARASIVSVTIEGPGAQVRIIIEDDGIGFDTACLDDGHSEGGGFGYFSIRERLTYLGGELEVESAPGRGTRVVTTVPVSQSSIP